MIDYNEQMGRGIGIFIRAYPNSNDILTNSITIASQLVLNNQLEVDAVGVVVLEAFPGGRLDRFDCQQLITVQIVKDFMCVALIDGIETAMLSYNVAVLQAASTYRSDTRDVSVKAMNNYVGKHCLNFDYNYPIQLDHRSNDLTTSLLINQYLCESITHKHLG